MALQSRTITVGADKDSNNGGKNYVSGQVIYIKDEAGVLAPIFRDIDGLDQIPQNTISNVTNAKGQFTFFIEEGNYTAEYNNQSTPLFVFGADYFNNQIDFVTNQILSNTQPYSAGNFTDGFTFTELNQYGNATVNDGGTDYATTFWYIGGTLPHAVAPLTNPRDFPFLYQQRDFNSAEFVATKTTENTQDFIDTFSLKIFQSPTDGLTEINTRTLLGGEVYEVRKVSDDSLATIYSDKDGLNPIAQNGTNNVSDSDGVVEFYIADGDYYIEVDSNNQTFSVRTPDYTTINLAGWGLKSGDSDIIAKIEEAIAISGVRRILVPAGDYAQDKKLEVNRGDVEILSEGACNITYNNSISTDGVASVEGNVISEHLLTTSTSRRFKTFLIAGASGIFTVGEDIIISSDALAYPNGRVYDLCYQISRIKSISGDTIVIDDYAEFDFNTADNAVVKKINWLDKVVIDGINFINSDDSTRFGLSMFYCREPVVKNTSMSLFNNAGIELWYCKGGEIHGNAGAIKKDESLNYSLAIYGCEGVSVYENSFSSARTAIDLSRMSRNCDVYENDVTGNINTHTAHYNTIRNNKVNEGGTLVRGPYNNVLFNLYKNSNKITTLGFNEAGQDGPSIVEDNEWYGPMTARSALYPCGISFNRNKLILTDIQTASGGDRILYVMHELSNYENSYVEFSDNELELSSDVDGSQVINTFEELPIVKNINIKRNISRNFKSGYDLQPRSDNASSSGLTFTDNELYGLIDFGVTWRLTDDVDISRNKFYGDSAVGSIAINRKSGGSSVRQGLRLQDNDLDGFDVGIEASGSLDYTDCIETGNKMINVNTKRVNTANFIPYVD